MGAASSAFFSPAALAESDVRCTLRCTVGCTAFLERVAQRERFYGATLSRRLCDVHFATLHRLLSCQCCSTSRKGGEAELLVLTSCEWWTATPAASWRLHFQA